MRLALQGNSNQPQSLPIARLLVIAILLLVAIASGCSRLRLPAIDPTGRCLFAPKPISTTLALPGSGGEDTLCRRGARKVKSSVAATKEKLRGCFPPKVSFPQPAFVQPVEPPKCATPGVATGAKKGCKNRNEACVPSVPCNGDCKDGPPAVVFEDGCCLNPANLLPRRGKRGCILLSPQKIVAPVGGEVVLLSGICGTDGYLQTNERLEWMLTPESVGTFIQVGDDDPNFLHRLTGASRRPKKQDPSYALGLTSTKRMLITRGNKDKRDDVQLEKGQTWISISSPTEGTSRVTVLAPESECWDQRKATATIYWIDATWQFPAPKLAQKGEPVDLTTRVTRAEGSIPAVGWRVRYQIFQPQLATFAGTGGSAIVEKTVDELGNATVQLLPNPGTSGTATIGMEVIRPAGQSDNMPAMTLGRGQTFVTWSSPQLAIRAVAPQVATFNTPTEIVVNVSNPGDQPATNVRVDVPIPQGVQVTGVDTFATQTPGAVIWELGTIPPQQQLDLFMTIATQVPVQLPFQATADGLRAEDSVRIDVFRPALDLKVTPQLDRYQVGQAATFDIDVTNLGDRPLQNVLLTATGDQAMDHPEGGRAKEKQRDGNAPLQPGETWKVSVSFVPSQPGQRCISVVATAAGGQVKQQDGCVTVLNPVPPAQTLSATLEQKAGRNQVALGETILFTATIANPGEVALRGIQVTLVNDPQLQLEEATEDGRTQASGNLVTWTIPMLTPQQSVTLEGRYRAAALNPSARLQLSAVSVEGSRASSEAVMPIVPAAQSVAPVAPPPMPPVQPAPGIPGGRGTPPAPLQGAPTGPTAPPLPVKSDRLQLSLFLRDNPVAVNDPIRYSFRVVNDSDQRDGSVLIQFQLPPGVDVVRVSPLTNPAAGQIERNNGVISFAPIRTMNPGEAADYEIVLRSNQRQVFDLNIQVRSERMPNGVVATARADVR